MSEKTISFLTDLDTLFDTRMGVIESYGPAAVERVVREGYFKREIDLFAGIDPADFQERYARRDLSVLKKSMATPMLQEVVDFMKKTIIAATNSPLQMRPVVVVNTHPYKLSRQSIEAIQLGLVSVVKKGMEVVMIDTPPSDIPLEQIREGYAIVAMYHYEKWLEDITLNGQLSKLQCPAVALYGPRMVKTPEGLSLMKVRDVYADIEQYTSIFFRLILMPSLTFSADMDRLAHSLKRAANETK